MNLLRRGRLLLLAAFVVLLAGCATVSNRGDPLEPMNRKIFAFNEAVDEHLLKPVATVYADFVPRPVRNGVDNFFNNIKDAWSAVNLFLQGRIEDGLQDMMRFGTNSVFGFFGIADVASEIGWERHGEDFGQTLGKWGLPPGAYIVWPILGPSTVRDSIGLPVDQAASPDFLTSPVRDRNVLTALRVVNARSNLLGASQVLDDIVLDKYTFVRDAYLQRRRSLVYDGAPPDGPDERYDLDPADAAADTKPRAAEPASAPASAASAP
jgi:phospholipid-binding lipoprotein MlaA